MQPINKDVETIRTAINQPVISAMTDRELLEELVDGQRQLIKALSEFQLPPMLETMFGGLFKR
jgi:hypothetical protein